jgi:hypothetical protein
LGSPIEIVLQPNALPTGTAARWIGGTIKGFNNREGATMKAKKAIMACCIAAGSLVGTVATPAAADVYVRVAPPPPRAEVAPAVRKGWEWAPGYWNWNGRRYVWVKGHRVRAHRGAHWVPHRWVEHHGRWRMEHGHWDTRR